METNEPIKTELTYNELLNRNKELNDKLSQCQLDKDFIWKLWKEFQVENPITANIVNSVIEREQEKSDAKDLKVLMIFEQKDKQINILQEVNSDLQTQLNITNEKVAQLSSEITSIQKNAEDVENEKKRLKNELSYKDELLKNKEKQLLIAENLRKDLEEKVKEQCVVAEKSTNEVEEKINELLEGNTNYQNTIDTLNGQLKTMLNETEVLKNELNSKDEELKCVISKLDCQMERKKDSTTENEEKENETSLLKETVSKKNKECDDLNSLVKTKEDQIELNNQKIRELSDEVEQQEQYIQDLKDKVKSYESYPKQIKEQIQLIQSLEKLQDETQHVLSQQEVTHQQEINSYQNNIYELKVKITKIQNDVARMYAENKILKRDNEKLESTCDGLKSIENSLRQELITISLELESMRNKLNLMEQAKLKQGKKSLLTAFTQTTPRRFQYLFCESSTQTEDESDGILNHKMKEKKEKLFNETQRLLALKSDINQENRLLKKRMLTLENQCKQLKETKSLIEKELVRLQEENDHFKKDVERGREENTKLELKCSDISKKLEAKSDLLKKRSNELEQSAIELQTMSAKQIKENCAYESVLTKLKSTEEELHVAITNCSKLSFQLKTITGENEILMEKQKSFQERIVKLDKMINQKKSLIDELKTKHTNVKNENERKTKSIENTNNKLKTLLEKEDKDKIYIEKLKTKLNNLMKEKSELQCLVTELRSEAEGKTHLYLETQKVCHKAEAAISAMEYTASQQLKTEQMTLQRKEAEFNSLVNKSISRVNEFSLVVKNFAEALLLQIHEKRGNILRMKTKVQAPAEETDNIFKKKACDLACSILNMSCSDLEEFMREDDSNVDSVLCTYDDNDIREKLDLILAKEVNFEKVLTQFLLDIVQYFWLLCKEEMGSN